MRHLVLKKTLLSKRSITRKKVDYKSEFPDIVLLRNFKRMNLEGVKMRNLIPSNFKLLSCLAVLLLLTFNLSAQEQASISDIRGTTVSLECFGFGFSSGLNIDPATGKFNKLGMEINNQSWCGSGFVIDDEGTIMTNYHVARRAREIIAKFDDGSIYKIDHIKVYNPDEDIAILKLNSSRSFQAAPLDNSDEAEVLNKVIAAGNGLCENLAVTEGTISQIIKRKNGTREFFRHSAIIAPGNSGGPLYRGDKVVGINTLVKQAYQFYYAVPINLAQSLLNPNYTPKLLEDIFPMNNDQIAAISKHQFSKTGTVQNAANDLCGLWSIEVDLLQLRDFFIVLEAEEGRDLALTITNAQGQYYGKSDYRDTNLDGIYLSTEFETKVYINVLNYDKTPANFGLSVYEIYW